MTTKSQLKFDAKALLAKLDGGRSTTEFRKDQIVFSQGEAADAAFFVQRGRVRISVLSEQGKEAIVAMLGENEFFGEGCLAGQPLRISTATAETDSLIVGLKKEAIVRLIHEDPEFSELFIVHLLSRAIRDLNQRIGRERGRMGQIDQWAGTFAPASPVAGPSITWSWTTWTWST